MTGALLLLPETAKVERPAKAWRNKYARLDTDPGGEFWGKKEWPSKDLAETNWIADWKESLPPWFESGEDKWLGAFPAGDA